ncbi:MAG: short chain dehydrogenase [Geminicoccaceae bacterium]|nr:short chain dehydrogenase [Geminicoccaceae bacterium]
MSSHAKRVALITGANRGIGFEIARQLGQHGLTVLVGARDDCRGAHAAARLVADGIDARPITLDVTDAASIAAAAAVVDDAYGLLDVLVNNAGVRLDNGLEPSAVPLEMLRATYETNVVAPVAVIQAFLPLLRRSPAGRIVNATSALASMALNQNPDFEFAAMKLLAYNSSKTALNAITVQFAHELRDTSIKVNAADPGYTATEFNGFRGTQTVEEGARAAVRLALLDAGGPTGGFFDAKGPLPW